MCVYLPLQVLVISQVFTHMYMYAGTAFMFFYKLSHIHSRNVFTVAVEVA